MILKICGITNQEDATAAIAGGATAIGFNFYRRSPRYLAPERAAGIQTAPGVRRVGVFVDEARERVEEIARIAALDVAQLHGDETRDAGGLPRSLAVWKAVRVGEALASTFRGGTTTRLKRCCWMVRLPAWPSTGGWLSPAPKPRSFSPAAWMPPTSPRPWRWPIPGAWMPAPASKARRARRTTGR
jgi:hypothetical protein